MENEELTKNAKESIESKDRKFRGWRKVNTSILLVAFFAPWLRFCESEVASGFQLTGASLFEGILRGEINLFIIAVAVGGVSFIVYTVLNLVRAITRSLPRSKAWLIIPLVGSVSILLLIGLVVLGDLDSLLWGYWLAWVGVLSSIYLEMSEHSSISARRQEESPP